ncbi:MAG: DUF4097 family beta strand repeat protein [Chloroflexi bacterium]|nr:DUF4097 family beta strand repeat protein [Chloroflexota bacterium]
MTTTGHDTLDHVIGPGGQFHLRQISGSIEVHGVHGDRVRVRERSGKALAEIFRIDASDGRLSLTAPDRGGIDLIVFGIGRRSSANLEVEVPSGASITIESASADLGATGLLGRTAIRTASGDIDLAELSGTLEIETVSGEAQVTASAALALQVRTISGDCTVRAPELTRATIETTSGDVRLDALATGSGPFDIQTVSGDVTIVGREGLRVEARTVIGELRSELPHRFDTAPGRKQLIVGDGRTLIAFRSVSGDLRVVIPRDREHGRTSTPAVSVPAITSERTSEATSEATSGAPAMAQAQRPFAHEPTAAGRAVAGHDASLEAGHRASQEVARLDILHALERGELSVEAAMQRLAEIEEA